MVVFRKEDSGRQLPLITPENGGGDETSSPSPPKFTFFDDSDVPFLPRPRGPFVQPRGPYPEPQDPPDPADDPGFPPGLRPAPPPAGGARTRAVDQSRERSGPLSEPQLIHIPNSNGDDDQPRQTGRRRQRSRSRERSNPHAQVHQGPQVQLMLIQESVTYPDEDPTAANPSSSTRPSPPVEQRDRSRRQQRSRSRERTLQRTPPHLTIWPHRAHQDTHTTRSQDTHRHTPLPTKNNAHTPGTTKNTPTTTHTTHRAKFAEMSCFSSNAALGACLGATARQDHGELFSLVL